MEELGESAPWLEIKMISLDGQEIDVEIASTPFLIEGKPAVQSIFRDIVERKLAKEHLEFLANFDALTGLPNRRLFFDRMGQSLLTANATSIPSLSSISIWTVSRTLMIPLGHAIGDLLLQEISARLDAVAPPERFRCPDGRG